MAVNAIDFLHLPQKQQENQVSRVARVSEIIAYTLSLSARLILY
jgi:hypothetical protein